MKPYKFHPFLRSMIWGGDKIVRFKGINSSFSSIGESWEISAVPGHESVVAERGLADDVDCGLSLCQLIDKYQGKLVGEQVYKQFGNQFPLLIKFIDANQDLSVQVHPDDGYAARVENDRGKTEMWIVLEAAMGAELIFGTNRDFTQDELRSAIENGTLEDLMNYVPVKAGDVFFIPAGLIHAIGSGILIAEIQQNCDTTYRVYDYNRRQADGSLRALHIDDAVACSRHFTDEEVEALQQQEAENQEDNIVEASEMVSDVEE